LLILVEGGNSKKITKSLLNLVNIDGRRTLYSHHYAIPAFLGQLPGPLHNFRSSWESFHDNDDDDDDDDDDNDENNHLVHNDLFLEM